MYTVRTLTGSTIAEMLHPAFRIVNYGDDPAVITVSTRLRQAWVTAPSLIVKNPPASENGDGDDAPSPDIGNILRAIQSASPEELKGMRNDDKDTIHTPLRDSIYYNWNHVFWDVARFLGEAACGTGHLHPPAEDVFAVRYPEGKDDEKVRDGGTVLVLEKVFETSVLVVPTFLDDGVKVVFEIRDGEEGSFTLDATGTEGLYNEKEVYWIRKGENVRISLGGELGADRSGVAGVFMYGKLCDCLQERDSEPEEDDDTEMRNEESKDGEDIDEEEPEMERVNGATEDRYEQG